MTVRDADAIGGTGPVRSCHDRNQRGRPFDPSRDDALRRAALELITEIGYDRMTIEAVAVRARAGKATVYRRWCNKADLVVDAVTHDVTMTEPPDTGSLRSDLQALSGHLIAGKDQLFKTRLISGMVSALLADPELRLAFQTMAVPPQRAIEVIIDRAVVRGEIAAPSARRLVAAVLPSLVLQRLIFTGHGPDSDFIDTVIENVVLPALIRSALTTEEESET